MGREFIGECLTSGENPKFNDYEMGLAIKYMSRSAANRHVGSMFKLLWKITNSAAIHNLSHLGRFRHGVSRRIHREMR